MLTKCPTAKAHGIIEGWDWKTGRSSVDYERTRKKQRKKTKKARRKEKRRERAKSDDFYNTYEWRKLRYQVLKRYGARCQCCGRSAADGYVMHIDHIKSRRRYPKLALDINNLQVLCNICNHGKGNWDETDWREPSLAVVLGERV